MKVTEYFEKANGQTLISFEVLPPLKGGSIKSIFDTLDPLMEFKPPFIDVTYHREEFLYKKRTSGYYEKTSIRKRPGTVGICAAIMNKYKVEAIPHLICGGFSKEETENALIDLNFLGVQNVLALRGDAAAHEKFFTPHPHGHRYAEELVDQIIKLNKGEYLEDDILGGVNTEFCIGVAGYPEKHFESANVDIDLYYLKRKIDHGADYITTQMFFNNKHYYNFVENCKNAGINVPIVPGLKPLYNQRQLTVVPSIFNTEIPNDLYKELSEAKTPEACEKVGEDWLYEQCKDLLANNTQILHFYTLGKPQVVHNVLKRLF